MNFELKTLDLKAAATQASDALIVLVKADFKPATDVLSRLIADARKSGDLDATPAKLLSVWRAQGVTSARVVLVSIGEGHARLVRQAVSAAVTSLKSAAPKKITLCLPDGSQHRLQAAAQAVADASYVYTATKPSAKAALLSRVVLALPTAAQTKAAKDDFAHACAHVAGVALAKEWGNRPANHATPSMLAKVAQGLAKHPRVRCEVLGPKEIEKLGMGSFAAVARGSQEPMRFIVLHYSGAPKAEAPTVLVGKGITFDTGGISLKPGAGMDEMKFDMCGAASVLGTFEALSKLQPAINVVGLIPTCENMPDGTALKPGDVITSMSGQTIEVLNTDAEGRLILADGLSLGAEMKPDAMIDIATLTGACLAALGKKMAGVVGNNSAVVDQLKQSSGRTDELLWELPLFRDYRAMLDSNVADMKNIGGPLAGVTTSSLFLNEFVGNTPWAHLDIAGPMDSEGDSGWLNRGATAFGTRLLIDFCANFKKPAARLNK